MGSTWRYRSVRRAAEALKTAVKQHGQTFAAAGWAFGAPVAVPLQEHLSPTGPTRQHGPAPKHPEKLVPHLAPTAVERVLWTELGFLRGEPAAGSTQ